MARSPWRYSLALVGFQEAYEVQRGAYLVYSLWNSMHGVVSYRPEGATRIHGSIGPGDSACYLGTYSILSAACCVRFFRTQLRHDELGPGTLLSINFKPAVVLGEIPDVCLRDPFLEADLCVFE